MDKWLGERANWVSSSVPMNWISNCARKTVNGAKNPSHPYSRAQLQRGRRWKTWKSRCAGEENEESFSFLSSLSAHPKKTKLRRDLGLGQRGEVKISRIKSELWTAARVCTAGVARSARPEKRQRRKSERSENSGQPGVVLLSDAVRALDSPIRRQGDERRLPCHRPPLATTELRQSATLKCR